jgi:diaminopimelate decarboxylase
MTDTARLFEGLDHERLIAAFGSPLFLFFPERLRHNIEAFREALHTAYAENMLCYSVKTNYIPFVVERAVAYGAVPEIISGLEIELLQWLGHLNEQVVVNGPLKTEQELRTLVRHRCLINVDNMGELELLNALAAEEGSIVPAGLRISLPAGAGHWARFGFKAEDGEAEEAALFAARHLPHVRIIGLHTHLGGNITATDVYGAAAQGLCEVALRLRAQGLIEVRYIDMGGGFATNCPFKDSPPGSWKVPAISEYVEAMAAPLRHAFQGERPRLIVEPGRALVDDAFVLLTTVERLRGVRRDEAILDAGINILSSARYRRHAIFNVSGPDRPPKKYSLYGPLCMQSDCFATDIVLPELRPGDVLGVTHAGAYSLTQCWHFIRLNPAIIALEGGMPRLVCRRETINDFMSRYAPAAVSEETPSYGRVNK